MHCRISVWQAALVALLALVVLNRTERQSRGDEPLPMKAVANILGLPEAAMSRGGTLVICGGGELPEEVYDEFVRLAGGRKSRLVLIPSAHAFENLEEIEDRYNGWLDYPTESFHFLHASSREEAQQEAFAKPLETATGVWITGGAQGRLADLYKGTRVETLLLKVLERGGVVGGTSAGAAIMSQTMIRQGTSRVAELDAGFSLLTSAVVDQHFTERARHTRLLGALRENPAKIGLGVDEQTALIVRANTVRVMGQNRATLIVPTPNRAVSLHLLDNGEAAEFIRGEDDMDGPLKLLLSNLANMANK